MTAEVEVVVEEPQEDGAHQEAVVEAEGEQEEVQKEVPKLSSYV